MKKIILLLILSINIAFSQEKKTEKSDIFYYTQVIEDSDFANKEFKLTFAVRIENYLENSKLDIGIIEKDENLKYLEFTSIYDDNIRNKDWKVYELKGVFKPSSKNFMLGIICRNKADFYFDDINLQVKNGKGKWEKIKIKNSGFEEGIDINNWNYELKKGILVDSESFTFSHTNNKPYKGKSCLLIKGGDILGSSSKGKTVDVNGVSLYYEIYGEGEPLLLLHGNGQSIYAFKEQVDEYAKHYKVIIVDCRGRGNSTYQHDVELTFDVEIEDLKQFLDKINIEKTHIVGWSDGGILGILMAIKYPEKVDKMVSMAGNIFPDGLVNKEELLDYVKQFQDLNTKHQYDKIIDFLYLDYKYPNLEYEELKVIKSKCLIMAGDKDEIKTEHTVKIFENIPNAQLAIVPNATHYLPRDNPKLFNEIILRFLKEE
jgi:pimeloyl-ACP methyl ester carboxylesterase